MYKFIKQSTTGLKTRFGKFTEVCNPGLTFYWPFIEKIHIVSNRLTQTSFKFNTKTKNDVFVGIGITIEYYVPEKNSQIAFFSMNNPIKQLQNNVENALITTASKMDLNTLFESRTEISNTIAKNLGDMEQNGYNITKTLVTSIDVDPVVKEALNKVEASRKLLQVAEYEAEADKVKIIKKAEAEKDSSILQGQGIAGQRNAILVGFSENIENFKQKFGVNPEQVFKFVLDVQHIDMLKEVGCYSKSNVVFLNQRAQDNDVIMGLYSKGDSLDYSNNNVKKLNDISL